MPDKDAMLDLDAAIRLALPRQSVQTWDRVQRLAILGQLAAGILHEFNNILTVASGTIDILTQAAAGRPDLAAVVRLIDEAALRGSRLTSSLQAFERGQPPQYRKVDVGALVCDAVRLLRPVLGSRIEVAAPADTTALMATADPGLLLVAVLGLAIAARNAMEEGGAISLQARQQRGGEMRGGEDVLIVLDVVSHASVDDLAGRIIGGAGMVGAWVGQCGGDIRIGHQTTHRASVEIHLPGAAADDAWLAES